MYTAYPQFPELEARSYTIGELADHFDISLRSIRFYEQKGLIKPSRSNGVMRIFSAASGARLGFIVVCRRLGLSVSTIGEILAAEDRGGEAEQRATLAAALRAHRDDLEGVRAETATQLDGVARWLEALGAQPPSGRFDAPSAEVGASSDPGETGEFPAGGAIRSL